MITKAILPPRKGYVEKINKITGEHYYHKISNKIGIVHRVVYIHNSQKFIHNLKSTEFTITIIGAGGSINSGINGSHGEVVSRKLYLEADKEYQISIGQAGSNGMSGEPTSFGIFLAAMGGQSGTASNSKPLVIDGIEYGRGETPNAPARNGICIIEYDEVIYE